MLGTWLEGRSMNGSTVWLIVIAIGAVVVAVGNIQYSRVREAEVQQELARQALRILTPELSRNGEILAEFHRAISRSDIPFDTFETTAWTTVSGSELIRGLVDETLPQWLRAYHLIHRANENHVRIVDLTIGVTSALGNSRKIRDVLVRQVLDILHELEPILSDLKASPTVAPFVSPRTLPVPGPAQGGNPAP